MFPPPFIRGFSDVSQILCSIPKNAKNGILTRPDEQNIAKHDDSLVWLFDYDILEMPWDHQQVSLIDRNRTNNFGKKVALLKFHSATAAPNTPTPLLNPLVPTVGFFLGLVSRRHFLTKTGEAFKIKPTSVGKWTVGAFATLSTFSSGRRRIRGRETPTAMPLMPELICEERVSDNVWSGQFHSEHRTCNRQEQQKSMLLLYAVIVYYLNFGLPYLTICLDWRGPISIQDAQASNRNLHMTSKK